MNNRSRWQMLDLNFLNLFFFVFVSLNTLFAFAGPGATTYQAKIIKPDGYPLEATSVNFKFSILNPAGSCVLYSETFSTVNMNSTGGLVSFALGTGVKTYPVSATTFEQVFSNITPNLSCDVGGPVNYTPAATDVRKIIMQFHDGSGWQTLPAMSINAVPYAMYANDSAKLGGLASSAFVQTANLPTCAGGQALFYNGASFSCVALGGSGVTSSTITTALGYTPADGASVTTNIASVSSTVFAVSATVSSLQSAVTSLSSSVATSFAAITSSQWSTSGSTVYYSSGGVGIGTSNTGATQLYVTKDQDALTDMFLYNGNGGTGAGARLGISTVTAQMFLAAYSASSTSFGGETANDALMYSGTGTRDLAFSSRSVSGSIKFYTGGNPNITRRRMTIDWLGNIGVNTSTPVTRLDVSGGVRIGFESASCAAVLAGTIRYNSGVIEYCNGTSWSALGVAGAGITLLNGSASGSQTFATGVAGTAFNISSLNGVHVFNIPLAASSSVTAGLLSNSDYVSFSNKADSTSLTNLTNTAATSFTSLTSNIAAASVSFTNLAASYTSLASSVSAITSSQWISSGTNIGYLNGNVGIGNTTSNANYKFQVHSAASAVVAMVSTDAVSNAVIHVAIDLDGTPKYGAYGYDADDNVVKLVNDGSFNTSLKGIMINPTGYVGVMTVSPTAKLHISAGNTSVAPLKFTSGSLLTAATSGAIEYDGFNLYFTDGANTRRTIATDASVAAYLTSSTITTALGFTPANVVSVTTLNSSLTSLTSTVNTVSSTVISLSSSVTALAASYSALSGSTTQWTTSGTNIHYLSGNVGIGTSNPAAAMNILNSADRDMILLRGAPGQSGAWIKATDANNNLRFSVAQNGSYPQLNLGASDTVRLTADYAGFGEVPSGAIVHSQGNLSFFNGLATGQKMTTGYFNGTNMYSAVEIANVSSGFGNLLLMKSGGRVGIGNSSPGQELDVSGTVKANKYLAGDGVFNAPSITFANNPNTGFYNAGGWLGISVAGGLQGTWTSSSLGFNAGGAGPQIYFSGGNAANPSYAFNVDSDTGMFNPNASGGSNELGFSTSGVERVRISSAGTVGIATSSPAGMLDIAWGGASGLVGGAEMNATTRANNQNKWFRYSQVQYTNNYSPFLAFMTGSTATENSIALGGGTSLQPNATVIRFYTGSSSSTAGAAVERMAIGSAGFVGIGTTTANSLLGLGSGTTTYAPLKFTSGALTSAAQAGAVEYDGFNFYITDGTSTRRAIASTSGNQTFSAVNTTGNVNASGSVIASSGTASLPSHTFNTDTATGMWQPASGSLAFSAAGNESLRLASNGNVGVGTSNPGAKLHINPSVAIENNSATANGPTLSFWKNRNYAATQNNDDLGSLSFYGHDGSGTYRSALILAGATGTPGTNSVPGFLSFNTTASGSTDVTERMRITASGAVGVNTNSPTEQFHVVTSVTNPTLGTRGMLSQYQINLTAAPSAFFAIATQGLTEILGTNTQNLSSTLTNGGIIGVNGGVSVRTGATGTLSNAFGVKANVNNSGAMTVTNAYGIGVTVNSGASGTTNYAAGISVSGVTAAQNNTQLLLGNSQVIPSGNYGIYNAMTYDNYFAGAIGIGVNGTASAPLDIAGIGSSAENIRLRGKTAIEGGQMTLMDGTGTGGWEIDNYGASGTERLRFFRDKGENNLIEPFIIAPTGYVGVNDTGPTATLSIGTANNINSGSNFGNKVAALKISDGSSIGLLMDTNQIEQTDGSNSLYLNYNSSATTIINYGGGAVGIGTASPVRKLHLANATNNEMVIEQTDALTNYKKWNFVVDSGNATTPSRFYIRQLNDALNGGNVPFTITASGSVGINTQTPTVKLEVANTGTMISNGTGATFAIRAPNSANADYFQVGWISEDNWGIMTADASTHRNLVVTPWGGNFGVGVIGPAYKLDVAGDIHITGTPYRDSGDVAWQVPSDARLKDVTGQYNRGLREIANIDTITYKYKKDNPKKVNSTTEYTGVLAQQVQEQIPEAVKTDSDGFLSLNTTPIFWAMVNALKEVYYDIVGIKAENAQLKIQTAEQARKIQSLEEENQAIKDRLERIEKSLQQNNK